MIRCCICIVLPWKMESIKECSYETTAVFTLNGNIKSMLRKFFVRWSEHRQMSPVEGCPTVFQAVCSLTPGHHQVSVFVPSSLLSFSLLPSRWVCICLRYYLSIFTSLYDVNQHYIYTRPYNVSSWYDVNQVRLPRCTIHGDDITNANILRHLCTMASAQRCS